jgi:hypothetical protein
MRRIVVVVGVGATLAEASGRRPPVSRTPPLDSTFFSICSRDRSPQFGQVAEYLFALHGIDLRGLPHTMEEVFNYLYSDAYSLAPPKDAAATYWALLRMYASVLARSTNPLDGMSRNGVGALLRHIWTNVEAPSIAFVTFNHDLVIEKAIENSRALRKYADIPWDVHTTYGREFADWSTMDPSASPKPFSSGAGESIPILKMHGSMN